MHKTLIVFEMVPESSHTYLLALDDETLKMAEKAHGVLAGTIHPRAEDAMQLYHFLFNDVGEARFLEWKGTELNGVARFIKSGFAC